MTEPDVRAILAEYDEFVGARPDEIIAAPTGLSGAEVWQLRFGSTYYCLRRWPGEVDASRTARVSWIHRVVARTAAAGFEHLAVPRNTKSGRTWTEHAGHIWEVAPWLPGEACLQEKSSPTRVRAALTALARFHVAAAQVERSGESTPSPGLLARVRQLESLLSGEFRRRQAIVRHAAGHSTRLAESLLPLARRWCELFPRVAPWVVRDLSTVAVLRVPLQPCLRDIHREHVLFVGDEVSGMVDYDAMRSDTVAGDLARLLESYVGGDADGWREGIASYEQVRPLATEERTLLPPLDASSILLSSANWIDWIYVQRIAFPSEERVRTRFAHWIERLEGLPTTPLFLDIR